MADRIALPPGITVFERGWLSSNNILFDRGSRTALVDSGYSTHSDQTVALVRRALGGRRLELLVNTHLHSDHCGGNAALQAAYPGLQTRIPPGQARHVHQWDAVALTYVPTGQQCPPFRLDDTLVPGSEVELGGWRWHVHAAPGHDPHSVVLFEPKSGVLISADALWENGFGVVFQELEGEHAFGSVGATLDLIESLDPQVVIPGHGRVFADVTQALANARRRLHSFTTDPTRHAVHATKVLLKFKLLELRRLGLPEFYQWANTTPYFRMVQARWFPECELSSWIRQLTEDLVESGAAAIEGNCILNA
jgi:glyoxylase-like metal-dependent hydrolase (beta-lactamase superfamily II)